MMHMTFADKSLLVGDEVADLLIEYSAVLAEIGQADSVSVSAYNSDGQKVTAKFALSEGAAIMAESTQTDLADPDNGEAETYIREQIKSRTAQRRARPSPEVPMDTYDEYEL